MKTERERASKPASKKARKQASKHAGREAGRESERERARREDLTAGVFNCRSSNWRDRNAERLHFRLHPVRANIAAGVVLRRSWKVDFIEMGGAEWISHELRSNFRSRIDEILLLKASAISPLYRSHHKIFIS